jgi:Na+/H+ antiporter NhaD/arsenite permease-like protein
LLVIIGAVFLPDKFFLRELVMLGAAVASYRLTPQVVHDENHFGFGPIKEVAFLFAGIFLTMMPALGYIDRHGDEFGVQQPAQYYFATGGLSAVLDNAPTYATFLRLAEATAIKAHPADFPAQPKEEAEVVKVLIAHPVDRKLVLAVSLGAVFFGAMTYIGNGPNFMVKSIAESAGVKVPTLLRLYRQIQPAHPAADPGAERPGCFCRAALASPASAGGTRSNASGIPIVL